MMKKYIFNFILFCVLPVLAHQPSAQQLLLVYPMKTVIHVPQTYTGNNIYISGVTTHGNIVKILLTAPSTSIILEEYKPTFHIWVINQSWKLKIPLYIYYSTNEKTTNDIIPLLLIPEKWSFGNLTTVSYMEQRKYLNALQKYLIAKHLFASVPLIISPINSNLDFFYTTFPITQNIPTGAYTLTVFSKNPINHETTTFVTHIYVMADGITQRLRFFAEEFPKLYAFTIILFTLLIGAIIPSATSLMLLARQSFRKKKDTSSKQKE